MPDVFITLEEAAAFEGITYEAMKKRVQRSPKQHNVKSQAREGGGKDQVLISTSSLSAKARKAWRAAQKVEGSEVIIDKRAQEAVPWYVTADLNQYTEANKKRFYEAVELAARVQDFIDYDGPDRTGYAERYALGLGISPQSLYRYMKNVLEANAWALKLEKEDGKSRDYFRALALCRKPKETGTFPSLTDEQKAIIENIWFDKRFAANLGTIEMLYERFELEAERREWEEYKRMTEPGVKELRPYWQYDAVNDSKTRPSHLAMDGRVFMADDPIWDTWFPPNGFKCRCTVKTLSKRQMEQRGLTVETEAPRAARLEDGRFVNILPDPQFDTNPAKVRYQPDLTGYPEPLKKAYQEREKGNTPP